MTVAENVAYGLKRHRIKGELRRDASRRCSSSCASSTTVPAIRELGWSAAARRPRARLPSLQPCCSWTSRFGALDRTLRTDLEDEIRRIHAEVATIVYVTHDREEALALSDRIAVIREGKLIQLGSGEELYAQLSNDFVARPRRATALSVESVSVAAGDMADVMLDGRKLRAICDRQYAGRTCRSARAPAGAGLRGRCRARRRNRRCATSEKPCASRPPSRAGRRGGQARSREARRLARGDDLRLYFDPGDAVVVARTTRWSA